MPVDVITTYRNSKSRTTARERRESEVSGKISRRSRRSKYLILNVTVVESVVTFETLVLCLKTPWGIT